MQLLAGEAAVTAAIQWPFSNQLLHEAIQCFQILPRRVRGNRLLQRDQPTQASQRWLLRKLLRQKLACHCLAVICQQVLCQCQYHRCHRILFQTFAQVLAQRLPLSQLRIALPQRLDRFRDEVGILVPDLAQCLDGELRISGASLNITQQQ